MSTASSPCAMGRSAIKRALLGLLLLWSAGLALAHQPYCEFADLTAEAPWHVPDARVSYAYFGNVYPAGDIDYFSFEAAAGQSVLLSLSIPAIAGIEVYKPAMAVIGPGIAPGQALDLPAELDIADGMAAQMIALGDAPSYFYEPFGGRYYWNYADTFFAAPEGGAYTVALWHPQDEIGRYSFVIGSLEVFGGQADCFATYAEYWTPLQEGMNPYRDTVIVAGTGNEHSVLLETRAAGAPEIDLELFPLARGGYYLRLKTANFTFAPDKLDTAAVDNEGHAHLYIDGEKIARLFGEWHYLDALPDGAGELTVTLNANDHRVFAVDGQAISASLLLAALQMEAP